MDGDTVTPCNDVVAPLRSLVVVLKSSEEDY